jgi:hypothetical protein
MTCQTPCGGGRAPRGGGGGPARAAPPGPPPPPAHTPYPHPHLHTHTHMPRVYKHLTPPPRRCRWEAGQRLAKQLLLAMYAAAAAAGGGGGADVATAAAGVSGLDALITAFRNILADASLDGSFKVRGPAGLATFQRGRGGAGAWRHWLRVWGGAGGWGLEALAPRLGGGGGGGRGAGAWRHWAPRLKPCCLWAASPRAWQPHPAPRALMGAHPLLWCVRRRPWR